MPLSHLLLGLALSVTVEAHNYVTCTNIFPNITGLLTDIPRGDVQDPWGYCSGYARAYPADNAPAAQKYGDQGWPWQGIMALHDNACLTNHRVANWLQQDPTYDPSHPPAKVKPQSSVLVQIRTNNHAHEYATRQSGHHKIFLAGPSGTQLTTANQLTFDRVVSSAPANKYGHIVGTPNFGPYDGDPGYSLMPLKLVDPTGAWLPEGTYNFVFAYFWATDPNDGPSVDYMIPDYSTSFDIVISNDANNTGAITDCVNNNPDCAQYLVGKTTSPGAKDTANPWPPYKENYLLTNFDGDDPSTTNGQRTFQPYWTKFVPASQAPAINYQTTSTIGNWSGGGDTKLLAPLPVAGGELFPNDITDYPNMSAGAGPGIPITQTLKPMSIADAAGAAAGNGTTS